MHEALRRALQLASRQYSLVTRMQALDAGMSRRTIDWLLSTGQWERAARGVYRMAGSPKSWEQRALALVLAAGADSAVSHLAAACLYGLDGFGPPGRIDLTVPRGTRRRIPGA